MDGSRIGVRSNDSANLIDSEVTFITKLEPLTFYYIATFIMKIYPTKHSNSEFIGTTRFDR